jgi:adenylate cyclase
MSLLARPARIVRELAIELARPGESKVSGRELWLLGRLTVTTLIVITNVLGACAVLVIAAVVIPNPPLANPAHVRLLNALLAIGYVVVALVAGVLIGTRGLVRLRQWLIEERAATFEEMRWVLRAPMMLFGLQVSLWLIAAVVFGLFNLTFSTLLGLRVAIVVATTGLVTASCAYLLTELVLRPAAARALAGGAPQRLIVPGVATRSVLAWVFGTGTQLVGIAAIGALALTHDVSLTRHPAAGVHQLGVAMVVLGATGIGVGLLAVAVVARTTADPIDSVRRALAEIQRGRLEVRVPVYDGTQIGQLQLGFNEMAAGLQERERIRDAFGTYVDPDVAARILDEGISLAGEEVEVTVMFIDIRNFTGFAERTDADRVVAAINELFEQFVPIIHDHGGRVDKFVGDGLLAVFGAPRRQVDHADQALASALEIVGSSRSAEGLTFGIGLNSGRVVAGNVGGAGRLEVSVIGDPVNVAARVEAATRTTGDAILVAERTRELLKAPHPDMVERRDLQIKGKREEVRLFAPVL